MTAAETINRNAVAIAFSSKYVSRICELTLVLSVLHCGTVTFAFQYFTGHGPPRKPGLMDRDKMSL